jgi:hypothetical protein
MSTEGGPLSKTDRLKVRAVREKNGVKAAIAAAGRISKR